jgi:aminoglycoside phosphotransferase (APT) family kinase protein
MPADASGNDVEDALDRERLADWLVEQSLVDRPEAMVVDPISGGNQNIVVRLGGGAQRMILRRPPRVVPDGRNAAMEREFPAADRTRRHRRPPRQSTGDLHRP